MDGNQFQRYLDALGEVEEARLQRDATNQAVRRDRLTVDKLVKRTTRCDGSDPTGVRLWIREIDLIHPEVGPEGALAVAAETVAGSLRAEFERFIQERVAAGDQRHQVAWNLIKGLVIGTILTRHTV